MRTSLANAVALWGAMVALWFALASGGPATLGRLPIAAGAASVVCLLCVGLGLVRGAAWPDRIGALLQFWFGRARDAALGARDTLRLIGRGRAGLKPALVRHRLAEDASERALFTLGASVAPGMLAVGLDPEGPLLHVLHEDDADDEDLAALAHAARRASAP